ncbi:MAG: nucleotidyl transferase AbiEii/AbiGii toxin family protein [Verrucomicrobia bacterium]|nr:nucleotidyl transferase AbiEii/AbiGii toxin family protein [Verrucomicrobiota bacterium]
MPDTFYTAKLYPFMDKVLSLLRAAEAPFYLTGGTALGRHYLQHRYSDDLDLFVNQAADFRDQVKKALEALRRGGVTFAAGTAADTFVRILACDGALTLKIDFINDVAFRYGDLQEAHFYPRIDHWRNILSNKLCALSRREPKDMADLLAIARRFPFAWPEIFAEARQKDLWVEPLGIARIIEEFPGDLLTAVKWEQPFDLDAAAALKTLHRDIFQGQENSLIASPPQKR